MSRRTRTLPCAVCDHPVLVADRAVFLEMVRTNRRPLCRQCGRFVSCERRSEGGIPGAARIAENGSGDGVATSRLTGQRMVQDKRKAALASRRLKRVLDEVCETAGEADE